MCATAIKLFSTHIVLALWRKWKRRIENGNRWEFWTTQKMTIKQTDRKAMLGTAIRWFRILGTSNRWFRKPLTDSDLAPLSGQSWNHGGNKLSKKWTFRDCDSKRDSKVCARRKWPTPPLRFTPDGSSWPTYGLVVKTIKAKLRDSTWPGTRGGDTEDAITTHGLALHDAHKQKICTKNTVSPNFSQYTHVRGC